MDRFEQVLAIVAWVWAGARITRLLVFDTYPPVAKLRIRWDRLTERSPWNVLLHCGYCASAWIALGTGVLALWALPVSVPYSHSGTWFWLIAGWLAGAYAMAIVVAYDGDD